MFSVILGQSCLLSHHGSVICCHYHNCIVGMVRAQAVGLKIPHCSFSLLLAFAYKDLNFVQLIFVKQNKDL